VWHAYGNAYVHSDRDGDSHLHADGNSDGDSNLHADGDCHCHSNCDTNSDRTAATFTDAATSADTEGACQQLLC
jgi:hypothetical protein